jgi:hypothetical protein
VLWFTVAPSRTEWAWVGKAEDGGSKGGRQDQPLCQSYSLKRLWFLRMDWAPPPPQS